MSERDEYARNPKTPSGDYRRIIPHGDVSPDGREAYPSPSLTSKIIVWGGLAMGAAGLTVAGAMAARGVANLISGDDHGDDHHRKAHHPRHDRHEAPKRRRPGMTGLEGSPGFAEFQHRADEMAGTDGPRRPQRHPRHRPPHRMRRRHASKASNASDGFTRLSSTIGGAISGLQYAAREAGKLIESFASSADSLRGVFDRDKPDHPHAHATAADADDPRKHRL